MRLSGNMPPRTAPFAHREIYAVVKKIPKGSVATYGQIAKLVGHCTARMVGYAMAAVPAGSRVPWQRVINAQGLISVRSHGDGDERQRAMLEKEGVEFNANGKVDLRIYGWRL